MHPLCPVTPQSLTASRTQALGAPGLLRLLEGPSPGCCGVGCLTWPRCHAFPLFLLSSADFVQINASQFVVSKPCRLRGFWRLSFLVLTSEIESFWVRALFPHQTLTHLPPCCVSRPTKLLCVSLTTLEPVAFFGGWLWATRDPRLYGGSEVPGIVCHLPAPEAASHW